LFHYRGITGNMDHLQVAVVIRAPFHNTRRPVNLNHTAHRALAVQEQQDLSRLRCHGGNPPHHPQGSHHDLVFLQTCFCSQTQGKGVIPVGRVTANDWRHGKIKGVTVCFRIIKQVAQALVFQAVFFHLDAGRLQGRYLLLQSLVLRLQAPVIPEGR